MTIRNKLTLLFTSLIAAILLTLNIYVYSLSDLYTNREFSARLEERAKLAAQIFLEKDEVDEKTFDKMEQRFLQGLPEEVSVIYDDKGKLVFEHQTGSFEIPDSLLKQLKASGSLVVEDGARYIVGFPYEDNADNYLVVSSAIDRYGYTKLQNLQRVLLVGFIVGVLLVFFTARYFSYKALHPMSSIVKQVNKIKANNLHLRVHGGNNKDEVAELARTFNNMLSRLESSFESQRTFVRNASHELRTPLAVMIGEMEVSLTRKRTEEQYVEALITVLSQARQMTNLVNDLLSLATQENSDELLDNQVRIDEVMWELQEEMHRAFPDKQLIFKLDHLPDDPDLITVNGNQAYLKRAIGNIVNNALKYSNGQPVEMAVSAQAGDVKIEVKDKGIGIAEEDLQRIFQPFYRGANARHQEGHGVGLPLTISVLKMHGGTIDVSSAPGKGTIVKILLPAV